MSHIHLDIRGKIADIRLHNPAKLNALTPSMLQQLSAHCQKLENEPTVEAVLVTAAPSKAFCAGADIREWAALSPGAFARRWVRQGHRVFDQLANLSKPTIAVISGHAFGGGLELAAACDIRVMHELAQLSLPEASVGVVPGWSGTQRLARIMPESVIKEMALFGRHVPAKRAWHIGFVADISETPLAAAESIAENLAGKSLQALEIAKYMIHAGTGENQASLIEALGSGMMVAHPDKAEGVAAFQEKRPAQFLRN